MSFRSSLELHEVRQGTKAWCSGTSPRLRSDDWTFNLWDKSSRPNWCYRVVRNLVMRYILSRKRLSADRDSRKDEMGPIKKPRTGQRQDWEGRKCVKDRHPVSLLIFILHLPHLHLLPSHPFQLIIIDYNHLPLPFQVM